MKSMTAYAYKESAVKNLTGNINISAEVKTYNSRFLDLSVHLPSWLSSQEMKVREYLSSRFIRGKVELSIRVKEDGIPVSVSVNENAAIAYQAALDKLAKTLGMEEKPNMGLIIGFDGVLGIESNRDAEKYWPHIEPVLVAAVDQAEAERLREGRHTMEDILSHIVNLEKCVKQINVFVPEIETTIKENLRSRFTELLGDKIDESRILAETAVLLMKYTISEELSRLSSHLSEFRLEMERNSKLGSSFGKKLDFLSQELNREINTIGSKAPMLEVSRAVVEMKNSLENIREQLRNVE